jgi:hypothetical protein
MKSPFVLIADRNLKGQTAENPLNGLPQKVNEGKSNFSRSSIGRRETFTRLQVIVCHRVAADILAAHPKQKQSGKFLMLEAASSFTLRRTLRDF